MSRSLSISTLAVLLTVVIIIPSAFFIAPQKTHAAIPVSIVGPDTMNLIQNTISAISEVASAASTDALVVNKYVLEPIAFVTSGNLIRSMTAGIIDFVNGKSNGTGASQFVRNLQGHMQTVGDTQASAFFFQFGRNSNSPFAGSINSSLRTNYLQQTSLAGFFVANRNTLPQYTRNQNAYLAGDWSQGGTAAWFALTTQGQNNPYMLHQRAQAELSLMIQDKTAARLQELAWGGGMLSWCGGDAALNAGALEPGTPGSTQMGPPAPGSTPAPTAAQSPARLGDPCTKSDGTPGTIQTPGSLISTTLTKTLGLNADKLAAMGNAAAQINGILGNMATVIQTANFANNILGSASVYGATSGLAGASERGPYGRSYMDDYQRSSGYLGLTQSGINQNAKTLPGGSDQQLLDNVNRYETAWNTIRDAANGASTNVTTLITTCSAKATTVSAAQRALGTEIAPVLAKATTASTIIAKARAMAERVQSELSSGSSGAYSADLQALQAMPPTATDVANAEQEAFSSDTATSSPSNALAVSEGTTVDQMNLLSANAQALQSSCAVILP